MTDTNSIFRFFGVPSTSSNPLEDRIKETIKQAIGQHLPADVNDAIVRSKMRDYINRKVQLLLDEELTTAQCVCVNNGPNGNPWTFITRIYLNNNYDSTYKCSVGLSGISDVEITYETGKGSALQ